MRSQTMNSVVSALAMSPKMAKEIAWTERLRMNIRATFGDEGLKELLKRAETHPPYDLEWHYDNALRRGAV